MATRVDREPPRPTDDDPRRAADELLGPAAGVCDSDRRVRAGEALSRAASSALQGLTLLVMYSVGVVVAIVVALGAQADDPTRRDAAVCHGAAEL